MMMMMIIFPLDKVLLSQEAEISLNDLASLVDLFIFDFVPNNKALYRNPIAFNSSFGNSGGSHLYYFRIMTERGLMQSPAHLRKPSQALSGWIHWV